MVTEHVVNWTKSQLAKNHLIKIPIKQMIIWTKSQLSKVIIEQIPTEQL